MGKTAVVTGAGRGVGKAVARALAGAGAWIVALDVDEGSASGTADEIKAMSAQVFAVAADVTCEADVKMANRLALAEFGSVDILFNNAGIQFVSPAEEMGLAEWRKVIDVNLTGTFICCQVFSESMIRQGKGKIINMSSVHGLTASGLHPAVSYNSSKAGILNLTRSLATEWARYGINVNAIAPGVIRTELTERRIADPVYYEKLMDRIPLKRVLAPQDIFGAAIFLASAASDMITGQTLVVDGGWLCHS